MLPIYIGAEGEGRIRACAGGLRTSGVVNTSSDEDIQATLDFLELVCHL